MNKFVGIEYKHPNPDYDPNIKNNKKTLFTITFKDSYRIFPGSLNELCDKFNVVGKFGSYDQDRFNNIDVFFNEELLSLIIIYAIQDSICLYQCLIKAQEEYLVNYLVSICNIWSTSTLSLKIYRTCL